MGIFSRFTDIVNSNINAILDKAEDPEKLVRLMIQEMEDTLVEVRSTAARAIADRKEISRSLTALEQEARDWQAKAELALDKEREDLAKAALAEKARVVAAADALRNQQKIIGDGLEKLNDDIVRLEEKLVDAKTRQQAISARHRRRPGTSRLASACIATGSTTRSSSSTSSSAHRRPRGARGVLRSRRQEGPQGRVHRPRERGRGRQGAARAEVEARGQKTGGSKAG